MELAAREAEQHALVFVEVGTAKECVRRPTLSKRRLTVVTGVMGVTGVTGVTGVAGYTKY